ncbi:uncharacterized protein LOC114306072 [Camellia sinensis]|uniref:uncharacterized protein LOC114306072 n=1 Tax=Camellia sinensis TaxID=4442 RepID=UPI001036E50C|nr:uncharacterized protein LOC114306072 [Camellia sinensis]
MECNKEEAIRAKEIAERKMQNKDFQGAQKFALKAQRLYPDLDNISQMIMVCDVHCSAENKIYGIEKDWYSILKIEPTADEASIKKQYRKFALLLHPDKNNFAGATDAFKLIGEAQRVLLDRDKRLLHDSKCKVSRPVAPNWAPQQGSSNHFMSKSASPSFNPQPQQPKTQTQPGFANDRQTFWTVCPFCSVRYQFYRDVVNKLLFCQSCKRSFTGYEAKAQAIPPGTTRSRHPFPQQKEVPNLGASRANVQGKVGSQGNASSENRTRESILKTGTSQVDREFKANVKCGNVDVKINKDGEAKSSGKVNGKRRKQAAESSGSDSEDIVEENGDVLAKEDFGYYGEYPRRSTRSKTNISYNEKLSDDDDLGSSSKRAKCGFHATGDPLLKQGAPKVNKSDSHSVYMEEAVNKVKRKESAFYEGNLQNGKEEREKGNGEIRATKDNHKRSSEANVESSLNSSSIVAKDPEIYEYPDPDFNDFDRDRREGCFAVGQIWAVYDTLDAMPRFYARIKKVLSPGFKLQITWLEPDPDDEDEIKWVDEGLPASCGKFKYGNSENTEDHPMFSHLILWEKGSRRDTYKIHPRKGETWALFKNWDIKWNSDPESRKYEFEFVEVLSDYTEGIGVSVAYLRKLRGFSCLFCRTVKDGTDSFQVPPNQLFRFSHRVPSFQMSGEERKDVPRGSFELDPACLPMNIEEIDAPQDLKVEPVAVSKENTSECHMNKNSQLDPEHISSDDGTEDPHEAFEIPDPEFYNFDDEKSAEKFETGQVWALYSDVDGLPKYYAQIKKIDRQPEFKLCIAWLAACPPPKNIVRWLDRDMLICCGRFKPKKGLSKEYTETGAFSHQLRAEHTDEKDVYAIFPKKGEVWALYKNWNAGITYSDLSSCEYDIVEILQENDVDIKVLFLEPVNGFKTVFKYQMKEGSSLTMKLPKKELLRFSHQIPFFRLTEERGGSLRGYWELDPAALPVAFFSSS